MTLLALISRRSVNGYELLDELSRLFGPAYQPSPGGVYPALRALLDEGLIAVDPRSSRGEYRITPAGKRALDHRRVALADIENRTSTLLSPNEGLEAPLARFMARVLSHDGHVSRESVEEILESAATKIEALSHQTRRERSNVR